MAHKPHLRLCEDPKTQPKPQAYNPAHSDLLLALRNFERAIEYNDCGLFEDDIPPRQFDKLLDELVNTGWLIPHEDDPATYTKA